MKVQEHYPLQSLNTLALRQSARYFVEIHTRDDLLTALQFARDHGIPWMVLGGGSNLVLSRDYPGLIIHNCLRGMEIVAENGKEVTIKVAAGENWHELVLSSLARGWYGLENLALIPGTAGAAPVQNIGAYGVELCDVFNELEAWDEETKRFVILKKQDCLFAYRDSIFKQQSNRFVIVSITLHLLKQAHIHVQYQALQDYFSRENRSHTNISPQDVFKAVVEIRRSKLPDPAMIPNAGSFFKNPLVSVEQYAVLLKQYPALVSYSTEQGKRKLAAGWLLEQAGWKGRQQGAVGVHWQQALVLVNHGQATGNELLKLANDIRRDIEQRYGVTLDIEPVIV